VRVQAGKITPSRKAILDQRSKTLEERKARVAEKAKALNAVNINGPAAAPAVGPDAGHAAADSAPAVEVPEVKGASSRGKEKESKRHSAKACDKPKPKGRGKAASRSQSHSNSSKSSANSERKNGEKDGKEAKQQDDMKDFTAAELHQGRSQRARTQSRAGAEAVVAAAEEHGHVRKADLVLKPGMPVYLTLEDVSVTLKPTKLANASVIRCNRGDQIEDGHFLRGDIQVSVNKFLTAGDNADIGDVLGKTRYGSDLKNLTPSGSKQTPSSLLRWPLSHIISQGAGMHFKRPVDFTEPAEEPEAAAGSQMTDHDA